MWKPLWKPARRRAHLRKRQGPRKFRAPSTPPTDIRLKRSTLIFYKQEFACESPPNAYYNRIAIAFAIFDIGFAIADGI
jgi:hypothetical protein